MNENEKQEIRGVTGNTPMTKEMKDSYLAYAMSVIKSRALPDVRDGMKPVHRRIIYGMLDSGFTHDKAYRKSARVVGEVMGKFHPHGDSSIYEALVRMAQHWSLSVPLIEGQGNFGSIDGDSPAAMRYTEARAQKFTSDTFQKDIYDDTVDFVPNYDGSEKEPSVLPARVPNLLINGGSGIAVGMASNIPPHNLGEVIDATVMMMDNPESTLDDIMRVMPGPDFPTNGILMGRGAIRNAYETGRGSMPLQAVYSIETDKKGRESIIVTEIPYAIKKTDLILEIVSKIKAKVIEGISDIRDESNSDGIRIVIDIKRDNSSNMVINNLLKKTRMLTSFPMNMTVVDARGQPCVLNVIDVLKHFITFRRNFYFRKTIFRLNKLRTDLEKQTGFVAATTKMDEIVATIRKSKDKNDAMSALLNIEFPTKGQLHDLLLQINPDEEPVETFKLTPLQAKDIVELRLMQLTGLEQENLVLKARDIYSQISALVRLIDSQELMDDEIKREMLEIKEKYNTPRRTVIESSGPSDINEDDLVEDKTVVLTMTNLGYIKITPIDDYREQRRGGKGKSGMDPKDGDYVNTTMVCNARDTLLVFTSRGIAHTLKTYKIQEAGANARGRPIVNYDINLRQGETIASIMVMPKEDIEDGYMMFVTDTGDVRRNSMSDFSKINSNGKIAMKLEDEHGVQNASLITVLPCYDEEDILLFTSQGKAIRFHISDIRVFKGRASQGIRGVTLPAGTKVIGATIMNEFKATAQERDAYLSNGSTSWKDDDGKEHTLTLSEERTMEMKNAEQTLITVTQNGFGKRFSSYALRASGRGGQGVWIGNFGDASGELVACFPVKENEGILLVTNGGQAIRTNCRDIRVMGRNTRGVKLFNIEDNQTVVDVARIEDDEEEG